MASPEEPGPGPASQEGTGPGPCWPISAHIGPIWAYVGPIWASMGPGHARSRPATVSAGFQYLYLYVLVVWWRPEGFMGLFVPCFSEASPHPAVILHSHVDFYVCIYNIIYIYI